MSNSKIHTTVAIVGAGPSGASAAYWLAIRDIPTVVLEKKYFPREKACGDGLTPRSVVQLESMGLQEFLQNKHRYWGLRAMAYGKALEIPWPKSPEFPGHGYIVTRYDLDHAVAENAKRVGAQILQGHEVVQAVRSQDKRINSLVAKDSKSGDTVEVFAKYFILAEGANSRIARSLGAVRDRTEPMGMAIRAYYETDRSQESWIESQMDLRDERGNVIPGYGWVFPLGDGRANIGFGLLTNSDKWKSINTTHALERYVSQIGPSWGISNSTIRSRPIGGKLQMGHAISPISGENFVLVGDTAGSINPFNGEGISYALETGRLGADTISYVLSNPQINLSKLFQDRLDHDYGRYYAIARRFVKLISEPKIMAPAIWTATRDERIMTPIVTIMANLFSSQDPKLGDRLYKYVEQAASLVQSATAHW